MQIPREPVVIVQALLVPLAMSAVLLFHLSQSTTGVVDALILALGGAAAALGVSVDALLPLLAGLAKAVLAVLLAFGLQVPEATSTFILSAIGIAVAFMTRPQVTPKASVAIAA